MRPDEAGRRRGRGAAGTSDRSGAHRRIRRGGAAAARSAGPAFAQRGTGATGGVPVAPPTGTQLVLLGTQGGPNINLRRSQNASAVVVDGRPYLIDCGYGTVRSLVASGVALQQVGSRVPHPPARRPHDGHPRAAHPAVDRIEGDADHGLRAIRHRGARRSGGCLPEGQRRHPNHRRGADDAAGSALQRSGHHGDRQAGAGLLGRPGQGHAPSRTRISRIAPKPTCAIGRSPIASRRRRAPS